MTGISTSLRLVDQMTAPIMSITNSINAMVGRFNEVENAADIDTSSLTEMQNQVNAANAYAEQLQEQFRLIQDALEETTRGQDGFNDSLNSGVGAAGKLMNMVKVAAASYASFQGVQKLMDLSDTFTSTTARLDLMNDGLQTTEELQDMIFLSAGRSRGEYQATADTVAKLGLQAKDAFSSNAEMIMFAEQMNKQFVIGGASVQEQASAMQQLTQAMASGRLQGDEFSSIMENAPMFAQAIASYLGVSIGKVREMSSEGALTTDVLKNALFAIIDETNARFDSMPKTFAQTMGDLKRNALKAFEPVLIKLNEIVNSEVFQTFVNDLSSMFTVLAANVIKAFDMVGAVGQFIYDNWSIIAPIIGTIVTVMGAYTSIMKVYNTIKAISNGITAVATFLETVHAARLAMTSGATIAQTTAQYGLNVALLACPLTWIILAIIAFVAILYIVIAAVNKFAGTSISATGIICGAFAFLGAFIWNIFMGLLELVLGVINAIINPFIKLANFIANVFVNPISSIIYHFQGMADGILAIIESIASALDLVFGSNMADTVSGWRSGLKGMADAAVAKFAPNENYQKVVNELDLSVEGMGGKRWAYGDAWDTGYAAGESIDNAIGGFDLASQFESNIPSQDEYSQMGYDPASIASGVSNIDANTKGALEYSEEELKLWRDIAERDTINRFTTAEVTVDFGGITNNVSSGMDLDGIVDYIGNSVEETLLNVAEGVHE